MVKVALRGKCLNDFNIQQEVMKLIQFMKTAKEHHQPKVSGREEWIKIKAEVNKSGNRKGIKLIALELGLLKDQ